MSTNVEFDDHASFTVELGWSDQVLITAPLGVDYVDFFVSGRPEGDAEPNSASLTLLPSQALEIAEALKRCAQIAMSKIGQGS